MASLLAGAVAVMTNPLYMEREIAHQMKDSGAKIIITMDMFVSRVEKVIEETELEHMIVTSVADYLPFPRISSTRSKPRRRALFR